MSARFSHSCLRFASRFMLAAMLFAQFALAGEACVGPRDMSRTLHHQPAVEAHCPYHVADEAPGLNQAEMPANLCVAHCTAGDQTSDTPQVSVFHAPALPVLTVSLALDATPAPRERPTEVPATAAPPPIPILFGAFRS